MGKEEGFRAIDRVDGIASTIHNLVDQMVDRAKVMIDPPPHVHLEAPDFGNVKPIELVLFCPICSAQHIDQEEPETGWLNPPHRSHLCHHCGNIFRIADFPTTGVAKLNTAGCNDANLQAMARQPAAWLHKPTPKPKSEIN